MAHDLAQDRLTQVFKFLKELNELRNPVERDLSGYAEVMNIAEWPVHPCIVVGHGHRVDDHDAEAEAEAEMEPLIRIKRACLTDCPKPPVALDGWLKPGWQAADAETAVLESRNFLDDEKKTVTVKFGELYATNVTLTPSDETQLAVSQPALAAVVSSADFRLLANEQAAADSRAQAHRPELWNG
jgi:hypothetical protein